MGFLLDRVDETSLVSACAMVEDDYRIEVADQRLGALPFILLHHLFPDGHRTTPRPKAGPTI